MQAQASLQIVKYLETAKKKKKKKERTNKQDRDRLILFSFSKKILSLLDSDEDQYLDYLKFCAYYCYVFMKRKYVIQNKTTHVVQNSRSIFVVWLYKFWITAQSS